MSGLLDLIGVDMRKPTKRKCGFHGDGVQQPDVEVPLGEAMSMNNGLQVTPEECRAIAKAFENTDRVRAAIQRHNAMMSQMFASIGANVLGGGPTMTEEEVDDELQFFMEYKDFVIAASKYDGFYIF